MSHRSAISDPVTGAYSRALLDPRIAAELSRAARTGSSCSLFLFDVDHFKSVNDSYGHQRGDEVLRLIVDRVAGTVRAHDELFRYGGDEFVLLLPDTERAEAVRLGTFVVEAIGAAAFPGTPPLNVSISLGVATFPDDAGDVPALMAKADKRNYLAKARGRGCAVADDADTTIVAASSRLLDRETAMAGLNELLTRIDVGGAEALAVDGPPGAGHTRFLTEAARIARLRGFEVVDATDPRTAVADSTSDKVLVIADLGVAQRARELLSGLRRADRRLGVVFARTGPADAVPMTPDRAVELTPWSEGTTRIWLRSSLQGEPSRVLVGHLHSRSGGLPGVMQRELDTLRERDALSRTDDGWTVLGPAPQWAPLPVPMTDLLGRHAETKKVVELLGKSRLVTLSGAGGIGKTRLSVAVASAMSQILPDGAVFVPLGELERGDLVIHSIMAAVGAEAEPGQSLLDAVAERLENTSALLVLDNFEQVIDAAAMLGELLRRATRIRLLVTSRQRLSLYGERVYRVPPLALPEAGTTAGPGSVAGLLDAYPALALFEQRAQAIDDEFAVTPENLTVVSELCRRLDGLPLAIELAAARIEEMSVRELLSHLGSHLDELDGGAVDLPERQRTLRAAIDWSVSLLPPEDRALFARLASFMGGFTAEAAATVAGPAGQAAMLGRLGALADKSLLVVQADDDTTRFGMLETVRAHAFALLSEDPAVDEVRGRHARFFGAQAAGAGSGLVGQERPYWVRLIQQEYANIRIAFDSAVAAGDYVTALRFCVGLWRYWCDGHYLDEGRAWCATVLASAGHLSEADRAGLLYVAAVIAHHQDDHQTAQSMAEQCLEANLAIDDRDGAARAHSALGMAASSRGDYGAALFHHGQSLETWDLLGFRRGVVVSLGNLTKTALLLNDTETADRYAARRLALPPFGDDSPRDVLLGLEDQIEIALSRGATVAADELIHRSSALSRELGDSVGEVMALHQSGRSAFVAGRPGEAVRLIAGALLRRHELHLREDLATSLDHLAEALAGADAHLAAELLGAAAGLRAKYHLPTPPRMAAVRASTLARLALEPAVLSRACALGEQAPLPQILDRVRDAADRTEAVPAGR